jgi:hypothetical protein
MRIVPFTGIGGRIHSQFKSMLLVERLDRRAELEEKTSFEQQRRLVIADLGYADGSNSMRNLQTAMSAMSTTRPVHSILEEHPASRYY